MHTCRPSGMISPQHTHLFSVEITSEKEDRQGDP
jgi:hypothetical protein